MWDTLLEIKIQKTDIQNILTDSVETIQTAHFYKLEKSVEDIQKEIEILRTRVMKYEHKSPEPNYTKQLKELIDKPPPSHKISLNNGSIIEGTIEKDKQFSLLVDTDVGKITINKSDVEKIDDLILPIADIIFIGHGQEKIFNDFELSFECLDTVYIGGGTPSLWGKDGADFLKKT